MTKDKKPKTASAANVFGNKRSTGLVHSGRVVGGQPINTDSTVTVPDYSGAQQEAVSVTQPVQQRRTPPASSRNRERAADEGTASIRISAAHARKAAYAKAVMRVSFRDMMEQALDDWFEKHNVPDPPTGFGG